VLPPSAVKAHKKRTLRQIKKSLRESFKPDTELGQESEEALDAMTKIKLQELQEQHTCHLANTAELT